ncbi:TIGR03618 family F420-dependent PPOX class oxidoreductase [Yinghuangia sp. ASG 101]|uniref:TIGR03618 family F420-dependent PPOX class oxidoreductase n=1 Tax=Yinghuangia sp. ASG 101 TaxID=2896848 RepID=UPI001E2FBDBE|nr:TIGR03618 family F420-dependent PPOX class oxidoreductase [Yinghuangia sp. ASG 101]UGQ11912.1 TIGR03618 family F420-dependent PPOX class oxidoreductase [Yinghuangia sp. ASG 101]
MSKHPGPRALGPDDVANLLGRQRFGVLATVKKSGHPHQSTVLYHWSPEERMIRISTTDGRLKTRQIRRDPRVSLHVNGPDVWSFGVAEGDAEVTAPTTEPGDAVGRETLDIFLGFEGPDDPDAQAAMLAQFVAEQRVVIRIPVTRLYGAALDRPDED